MKMPDTKQHKFNIMLPVRAMDSKSNGAAGAVRTALQALKVACYTILSSLVVAEAIRNQPDAADVHPQCSLHLLLQFLQEGMRHRDVTWFQINRCIGRIAVIFCVHEDRASAGKIVGVPGLIELVHAGLEQGVAH